MFLDKNYELLSFKVPVSFNSSTTFDLSENSSSLSVSLTDLPHELIKEIFNYGNYCYTNSLNKELKQIADAVEFERSYYKQLNYQQYLTTKSLKGPNTMFAKDIGQRFFDEKFKCWSIIIEVKNEYGKKKGRHLLFIHNDIKKSTKGTESKPTKYSWCHFMRRENGDNNSGGIFSIRDEVDQKLHWNKSERTLLIANLSDKTTLPGPRFLLYVLSFHPLADNHDYLSERLIATINYIKSIDETKEYNKCYNFDIGGDPCKNVSLDKNVILKFIDENLL
jgi:hypothetical protein